MMAELDMENELAAQLSVQREAVSSIDDALASGAAEEQHELVQMREELIAAVSELEAALLEVKRARMLRQFTSTSAVSVQVDGAHPGALLGTAERPSCSSSAPPAGTSCQFRYMDGRWYAGRIEGRGRQAGTWSVSFTVPTRSFMLEPVDVMEGLVRPLVVSGPTSGQGPGTGRGQSAAPPGVAAPPQTAASGQQPTRGPPAAVNTAGSETGGAWGSGAGAAGAASMATSTVRPYGDLAVGRRALARLPGGRLFVPVEVMALDAGGGTARVLPLLPSSQAAVPPGAGGGSSGEVVVPLSEVAKHAHVPPTELLGAVVAGGEGDGEESGGGSDGEGSSSSVSALLRPTVGGGQSSSSDDGSDDDSSMDQDGEADGGGGGGDDGSGSEGGDEEGEAEGDGLDVFGHARLAAATGALDDAALLADWEAHSRGVASRLLVRMGFVRGRGLGSRGQGSIEAPEVLLLPERRGLGAADKDRVRRVGGGHGTRDKLSGGVVKRRKRGGAKAKRKGAIVAARKARQEAREREEGAPGGGGLFDFLNTSLGDASAAARIRKAQVDVLGAGVAAVGGGGGGAALPTAGAVAIAGAVRAAAGAPPRAPTDRRGLMSHHDNVAGIQTKLARLREMLDRNRDNRGLRGQIEAQIRATQAELSAAQSAAARVSKAISDKDAQKKWLKF